MTTTTDLAEFVSDYWRMYRENGGPKPTAAEIADQYMEHEAIEDVTEEFKKNLVAQIAYYLP